MNNYQSEEFKKPIGIPKKRSRTSMTKNIDPYSVRSSVPSSSVPLPVPSPISLIIDTQTQVMSQPSVSLGAVHDSGLASSTLGSSGLSKIVFDREPILEKGYLM
jgi:hypothetical protein